MIENKIYCYVNGFLKWNISKNTCYIVGNKKFTSKICVLNLRNKRKSIFQRVIIRYYRWKKITKETSKIVIKSTYEENIRAKFRKCITRGKLLPFTITIDTSRSNTKMIRFIIFILMTFRYYFTSLQHPWYHTFTFHLLLSLYLTLIIFFCFFCLSNFFFFYEYIYIYIQSKKYLRAIITSMKIQLYYSATKIILM